MNMKQDKLSRYSTDYLKGFQDALDVVSRCIDAQRDAFGRQVIPKTILEDIDESLRRVCANKFGESSNNP